MDTSEKLNARKLMLVPLGCAALASLGIGIKHAFQYESHDLQWMGGRLLAQHVDPWQEQLLHAPNHYAHFSPPNYLHALYLLWLPFAGLRFSTAEIVWVAITVFLSIASMLVLRRLFDLSWLQMSLALGFLWMSSPFRVVLEVGQMSCFELFFLSAAYAAASEALGGLALGMSLVKYSFSPPAILLFLFRRRFRLLSCAAIVPLIGLIGAWLLVSTPIQKLAFEPLTVSSAPTAVSPGFADLMTVMESVGSYSTGPDAARKIAYISGLVGCAAYAFLLSRFRLSRAADLTLVSLASLFFVKHLVYDYVFLLPVLCFAIVQRNRRHQATLVAAVAAFWFVLPTVEHMMRADLELTRAQLILNCCLLAGLMAYTTYLAVAAAKAKTAMTLGDLQTTAGGS